MENWMVKGRKKDQAPVFCIRNVFIYYLSLSLGLIVSIACTSLNIIKTSQMPTYISTKAGRKTEERKEK